jgi:hypothetical protein
MYDAYRKGTIAKWCPKMPSKQISIGKKVNAYPSKSPAQKGDLDSKKLDCKK